MNKVEMGNLGLTDNQEDDIVRLFKDTDRQIS